MSIFLVTNVGEALKRNKFSGLWVGPALVVFVVLAFLTGCTGDNRSESNMQEQTFSLRTNFNEYTNDEISILLFDEIVSSFSPDLWDFLVLAPDSPIQGSTFIQAGSPQANTDFKYDLQIGFDNAETGLTMYCLYTEDKNVVLQYFVDYWQEYMIPDISLWHDMTDELE